MNFIRYVRPTKKCTDEVVKNRPDAPNCTQNGMVSLEDVSRQHSNSGVEAPPKGRREVGLEYLAAPDLSQNEEANSSQVKSQPTKSDALCLPLLLQLRSSDPTPDPRGLAGPRTPMRSDLAANCKKQTAIEPEPKTMNMAVGTLVQVPGRLTQVTKVDHQDDAAEENPFLVAKKNVPHYLTLSRQSLFTEKNETQAEMSWEFAHYPSKKTHQSAAPSPLPMAVRTSQFFSLKTTFMNPRSDITTSTPAMSSHSLSDEDLERELERFRKQLGIESKTVTVVSETPSWNLPQVEVKHWSGVIRIPTEEETPVDAADDCSSQKVDRQALGVGKPTATAKSRMPARRMKEAAESPSPVMCTVVAPVGSMTGAMMDEGQYADTAGRRSLDGNSLSRNGLDLAWDTSDGEIPDVSRSSHCDSVRDSDDREDARASAYNLESHPCSERKRSLPGLPSPSPSRSPSRTPTRTRTPLPSYHTRSRSRSRTYMQTHGRRASPHLDTSRRSFGHSRSSSRSNSVAVLARTRRYTTEVGHSELRELLAPLPDRNANGLVARSWREEVASLQAAEVVNRLHRAGMCNIAGLTAAGMELPSGDARPRRTRLQDAGDREEENPGSWMFAPVQKTPDVQRADAEEDEDNRHLCLGPAHETGQDTDQRSVLRRTGELAEKRRSLPETSPRPALAQMQSPPLSRRSPSPSQRAVVDETASQCSQCSSWDAHPDPVPSPTQTPRQTAAQVAGARVACRSAVARSPPRRSRNPVQRRAARSGPPGRRNPVCPQERARKAKRKLARFLWDPGATIFVASIAGGTKNSPFQGWM